VTVLSAAGLLAFELVIIYQFWLSSRDYSRTLAKLEGKITDFRSRLPAEEDAPQGAAVGGKGG
jgi:hypothetical protein